MSVTLQEVSFLLEKAALKQTSRNPEEPDLPELFFFKASTLHCDVSVCMAQNMLHTSRIYHTLFMVFRHRCLLSFT